MTATDWRRHRERALRRTRPVRHGDEESAVLRHVPTGRLLWVSTVVVGRIIVVMIVLLGVSARVGSRVQDRREPEDTSTESAQAPRSTAAARGGAIVLPGGQAFGGTSPGETPPVWEIDACGRPRGAGLGVPSVPDPWPGRAYSFDGRVDAKLFEAGRASTSGLYDAKVCGTVSGGASTQMGAACGLSSDREGKGTLFADRVPQLEIAQAGWQPAVGSLRPMSGRVGWVKAKGPPSLDDGVFTMLLVLPTDGRCLSEDGTVDVSASGVAQWTGAF